MAVETGIQLKMEDHRVVFPLRGGIGAHGTEVLTRARELGLVVREVAGNPASWYEMLALLQNNPLADVYSLRFFMSQDMLAPFYATADAVLANSSHEPFGLVGIVAMTAGGLVFTGGTGDEYTLGSQTAVVQDTQHL
jgi:glycosyltransferase involved in cell wall biosynthesis